MADVLTEIHDEIEDLIGALTIVGGYNYDWNSTSVNPKNFDFAEAIVTDLASAFPIAFVHYGPEVVEAPTMNELGANGQTYTNDIDFIIECFVGASDADAADVQINKALADLKKLFFNTSCLNGKAFVVLYTGHNRDTSYSDSEGCAGRLFFKIKVRYNQDTTNPEVLA